MISDELAIWMKRIEREIEKLKVFDVPKASSGWVDLGRTGGPAVLTSTSWDGDSYSTTAKTLIDLSVVFGVPAGVKAVDVSVFIRDSASAATETYLILSPNNSANEGKYFACSGLTNDLYARNSQKVVCDANGDIYYQTKASGASTLDIWIQIHGYQLP